MSEKIRLFVAVAPPEGVVERLSETARGLRAEIPPPAVAWVLAEQIHLTLHFLGEVERERVGEFELALEKVCGASEGCLLRAGGLGCFPSANRPRVVWAGLQGAVAALESLKNRMEPELERLGYVPEKRAFHPHLTLGRVKELNARDRRNLARALEENRERDFGEWRVKRVDLMESVLGRTGARYRLVRSFEMMDCGGWV